MHVDVGELKIAPRWDRFLMMSAVGCALALPVAYWRLEIDITTLWGPRAQTLSAELLADSWPPEIGNGGLGQLISDSSDTVALAVLSIAGAALVALPISFLAARPTGLVAGFGSTVRRLTAGAVRFVMLVARSVPPPVGAFIVVFVLFPGLWPGAVALAIYNAGVLSRLQAEVVENVDDRPAAALRAGGASGLGTLAYATMPAVAGKFVGLGLYRWEVAIRETVIVGVVGAAGLGRRLDQQTSAFDYDGILATIIALIVVTVIVDLTSAAVRRSVR